MPNTSLRVAITGGTGFVGRHVIAHLLAAGHNVRALARNPASLKQNDNRVELLQGDLFDPAALDRLVTNTDAVVHIVGIIMEHPRQGQTFERVHTLATQLLLAAAKNAGVRRWAHMSALGARPDAVARYHQTKWLAEQAVRQSGITHTIFRPSIIHGPDGEFMQMVKAFWTKSFPPFVPYFSSKTTLRDLGERKKAELRLLMFNRQIKGEAYAGNAPAGLLQPVYVEDVARCFVDSLTNPRADNETYPLAGPETFTWPQLFLACKRAIPNAKNKIVVPIPVRFANFLTHLPGAPFNRDQIIMSQEDSTARPEKAQDDFAFQFAPFEPTFADYAAQIE